MLKRIKPDQVARGMYIHGFEGSWFSHPFWRSRFVIDTDKDVALVRQSTVDAVMIDCARGVDVTAADVAPDARAPAAAPSPRRIDDAPAYRPHPFRPQVDRQAEDRRQATQVVARSKRVMRQLFDDVRFGRVIHSAELTSVVDDISSALDRNRSMLIGITRLKSKHEYTYLHSVAVCALMVNLARQIGLNDATARGMGMAGLLHDVGKTSIDAAILDKPGALNAAEFAEIRHHTTRGHAMLSAGIDVPETALDVCLHHHEKIDGSGYPFGLAGSAISLAARMGAICDVYDAVTSARAYKAPWSPVDAITAMDGWTGHFDRDLLFRFMVSIDIYPVGTLVRLRSNRLALVMDNGRRASRVKLTAFYAIPDRAFVTPSAVVLSDTLAGDQVIAREDPAAWGFTDWSAMAARLLAGKSAGPAAA